MIDFLHQFGLLFLVIVAISFLVKLMRQPIIVGYVLSGLLFSIFFATRDFDGSPILLMAELGITFLLFLMGLEFDFKSLRYLGKEIIITTSIQSLLFFGIGFLASAPFHFSFQERIYLSILFMFSSTLLVAKWIEDKKEINTLHGKVILGTLIIQDVFAILALTFLGVAQETSALKIVTIPLLGFGLLGIAFLLTRFVLEKTLRFSSKFPELLFMVSLGVCFLFVEIAPYFGYSATIGAFIAGVTLANTIYKNDILSRLKPLIIFFNMLFFVGLGFQMNITPSANLFLFIGVLCVLSLFLKPIIIYATLRWRGYDLKTSFYGGIYLAQLSEFGIIIIAAGILSGNIGKQLNSLGIIAIIVTMIISSYFIKYDRKLLRLAEPFLRRGERFFKTVKQVIPDQHLSCNVLFFGYQELGQELHERLKSMGKNLLVVESDPEQIELLKRQNANYVYSSVRNPDFFNHMHFKEVELVISNSIDLDENKIILNELKKTNPNAVVILSAKSTKDSLELYDAGTDYVIYHASLNHQHMSLLLEDYTTDINKMIAKKFTEISRFEEWEHKRKKERENTRFFEIEQFLERVHPQKLKDVAAKKLFGDNFSSKQNLKRTRTVSRKDRLGNDHKE